MAESPDGHARPTHPLTLDPLTVDPTLAAFQSGEAVHRGDGFQPGGPLGASGLAAPGGDPAARPGGTSGFRALAAARAGTQAAMARLVRRAAGAADRVSVPLGDEHLLLTCAGMPCAVPLAQLREVLPALPATTALPYSPPWLLGVFPLRTELVALVDPVPVLCERPPADDESTGRLAAVLVAGDGEECLGLAVAGVGDIAVVRAGEIVRDASGLGGGVRSTYVAGWYAPPGGRPAVILDLPRLVTDLLRELTEESADG